MEVLNWLDHGIIYHMSNVKLVSPTQVVPKKNGIAVTMNDKNEPVLTQVHLVHFWWSVCNDYRKLNATTCKEYFLRLFLDRC